MKPHIHHVRYTKYIVLDCVLIGTQTKWVLFQTYCEQRFESAVRLCQHPGDSINERSASPVKMTQKPEHVTYLSALPFRLGRCWRSSSFWTPLLLESGDVVRCTWKPSLVELMESFQVSGLLAIFSRKYPNVNRVSRCEM